MAHMFTNGMPMILGDQMGLGKTIQSIGLLAHLQSALGQGGPHLVVVPLSVLSNWLSEIERFCPSMRAVRFHGMFSFIMINVIVHCAVNWIIESHVMSVLCMSVEYRYERM
jgi:SNF2 family DNA or RNA helicase